MSGHASSDGFSVANQTLDNTLGAIFLGIIGATFLFGVTTLQVYMYYHRYPGDSRLHKFAVAVLWTLDLLHLIIIVHAGYHYTVKSFGVTADLAFVVWSVKLQATINVIIIVFVQSLYAYRVWILGGYHHGILGYIVAGVVVGGFGIGVVLAYKIYTIETFQDLQSISWAIISSLATSTAIDFTIASVMCFYLHKSRVTESRLNSRISTVMQYTLSSGLFTSACSLSTLFTYALMPNNLIFLSLQFLSTKFYMGSFLAMLNARQRRSSDADSAEIKRGIEFRVQSSTYTDFEMRHWRPRHERSTLYSSPPTSPSDSDTTYVSFDRSSRKSSRKSMWDVEALPSPVATVHPVDRNSSIRRQERPEYMSQW